jgi:hypothetical protein
MFTLSQASYDTKELLKWGGLFIGGLVVVIIFIQLFLMVKNAIFPTPPPKPTVVFGKLDPQLFPPSVTDKKLTYKINTLTGALPSFKDQLKVYKIKTFPPDLLSLQNASNKVEAVNFKSTPIKISETNYEWTNTDPLGLNQTINMNTVNNNFSLTSDFLASPSAISGALSNEADSIKTATDYLSKINTLPTDIDTTNAKTSFVAAQNGAFVPVSSLADANAVRVDLFQKDVDTLPVAY